MDLNLESLPVRMPRKAAAALISQHFFTVAARSLERWPLDEVYVVNGARNLGQCGGAIAGQWDNAWCNGKGPDWALSMSSDWPKLRVW